MIYVQKLRDLNRYGIIPLTGEADNLAFRMLCDLTFEGRRVVSDLFGIPTNGFAEQWNGGTNEDPHVASVMLPYDAWKDVGIIAMLEKDCHMVLAMEDQLIGLEHGEHWQPAPFDWETGKYTGPPKYSTDGINWTRWPYGRPNREFRINSSVPHSGGRNIHQMSGRSH